MNKNRSNRGQMRIIEVIIALFIIVIALSFANLLSISPASPKYESTELEKLGYNVLHDLDKLGLLSRFVYNQEWQNFTSALRVNLPINVYFNTTVYELESTTVDGVTNRTYASINDTPISYGDVAAFTNSKDVSSVTYSLVGCVDKFPDQIIANYDLRIIVLQLMRG